MAKLTEKTSFVDAIEVMSEGSSYVEYCIKNLIKFHAKDAFECIRVLDRLDIRGEDLRKLWRYCCGENMDKFIITINAFKYRVFTKETIYRKLNQTVLKPFIYC